MRKRIELINKLKFWFSKKVSEINNVIKTKGTNHTNKMRRDNEEIIVTKEILKIKRNYGWSSTYDGLTYSFFIMMGQKWYT